MIYYGGDHKRSLYFQIENVTEFSTTTYHKSYTKRKSEEQYLSSEPYKLY